MKKRMVFLTVSSALLGVCLAYGFQQGFRLVGHASAKPVGSQPNSAVVDNQSNNLTRAQSSIVRVLVLRNPGILMAAQGGGVGSGHGSGVIINSDCVLTCAHVVENLADGDAVWIQADFLEKPVQASVLGCDDCSDIALLHCELPPQKAIPIQMFNTVPMPGQTVYAVGYPSKLGKTITSGIVSAKELSGLGMLPMEDFIATDAVVGPGSSGGALIDAEGRMVGLVDAIMVPECTYRLMGLAISTPLICTVIKQLQTGEPIRRGGFLGARVGYQPAWTPTPDGTEGWVQIADVLPFSPAEQAGLEPGDIIIKAGAQKIDSVDGLLAKCRVACPGDKLTLTVARSGCDQCHTLTVSMGDMNAPENAGQIVDYCPYCGCCTF